MERSEGLRSSSHVDVSASSALHISEDAFWAGLTKVFHFIFINIFLSDTYLKSRKQKQNGDFFHSTVIYNIINTNVEKKKKKTARARVNILLRTFFYRLAPLPFFRGPLNEK